MKTAVVASLSAVTAVFLSIPEPMLNGVVNQKAVESLAFVQFFWLGIMMIGLGSVFWDFTVFAWQKERELSKKYDIPSNFLASFFVGSTFVGVLLNLLNYIGFRYPTLFGQSIVGIFLPGAVFYGGTFLLIFAEKKSAHIWRLFINIIYSIVLGLLLGVAGMYLEIGVLKYVHFFWFTRVVPGTILLLFLLFTATSIYRKKPLFRTIGHAGD